MKFGHLITFLLTLSLGASCRLQNPNETTEEIPQGKVEAIRLANGPETITRSLLEDKTGNLWIAAFDGVYKYDGKTTANIISDISSARFFSILEDSKGDLWFGSIGSGVYQYDGKSFKQFTTDEGLVNNEIGTIYEDKDGNIYFGANGGFSIYDGNSFRNFILRQDSIVEDKTGEIIIPNLQRPPNEITTIIQDQIGRLWFGTRGKTFTYDGKKFEVISQAGRAFMNVRSIIQDQNDNIWLGGNNGLWRFDGHSFTSVSEQFTGYIYEDKIGNIWTSSQAHNSRRWVLTRYEKESLAGPRPVAKEFGSEEDDSNEMIFGLLKTADGDIWFGGLDGAYRYKGSHLGG